MRDKDKIEKLKSFDENKYENVDLDHLIMYVIGQMEKIGADLSLENAVVAAFKLFPKKFSLLGFPSYPDSLRVYSCLWRCTTDKKTMVRRKNSTRFYYYRQRQEIYKRGGESFS